MEPPVDSRELPTPGRVVLYRSRTGNYTVPALVTATVRSIAPDGIIFGGIPPLSSDWNVHLHVLTPGRPGQRAEATDFVAESPHGRSENIGGGYQEFDVAPAEVIISADSYAAATRTADHTPDEDFPPGTWAWPARA